MAACRIVFHLNNKDIKVSKRSTETIESLVIEALCKCDLHVNDNEHNRIIILHNERNWIPEPLAKAGQKSISELDSKELVCISKQH